MTLERSCPICRETANSSLFAEEQLDVKRLGEFAYASRKFPEYMHLRLLQCHKCDLIYASSVPDSNELKVAYEAAAYDSQTEAQYAAKTYGAQVRALCKLLPDRESAIDIGAGDGAFCRELKSLGFQNVVGLEPSAAPIAAAHPDIRDCLRQEMFSARDFPEGKTSLITCFQTIEHVLEPAELCREAVRLLKPGGALCLIAHNRRSLSCKVLGRKSPIFDIEHLQLFSPQSLRRLLGEAGLQNVVAKPIFNSYPISYWTKLFPFPTKAKLQLLKLLETTRIGRIPLQIPAGNLISWGVRPFMIQ